jgi:hypothetical protein
MKSIPGEGVGAQRAPNMVEAPGIENESGRDVCTISRRGGTIRRGRALGSVSSRVSKCTNTGGVGTESSEVAIGECELRDVVEPALARALVLAAEALRWEVVVLIATELQKRREGRFIQFEADPTMRHVR